MKKKLLSLIVCFATLTMMSCNQEQSQNSEPVRRKSPIAIANVTHKPTDTYVKIVYGQPYKRSRDIFGGLEAYGEVWRTGANEATEITTTKPLYFNGNKIDAGTYALFTIPRPERWTIILNDSLGQWGAFDYNEEYDYLRTVVEAEKMEQVVEAFTIEFSEIQADSSSIVLRWDTTRVAIPIRFIASDSTATP